MEVMTNYNRIWMISDLHFGARSNALSWLEIQTDYFYNFFIPKLKEEKSDNDVLFILGDVFDNRQTLNIYIMNTVIKLFQDLAKIIDVHIIIGNHDIFEKQSNEITSLACLQGIKNLTVHKDPIVLTVHDKKCLLMPWRRDAEHELETLNEFKEAEYLFCHSEVKGVKLNAKSIEMHGNDIETFKSFKRIYSGHIHYSQKRRNFRFVGNPYEMTRSDMYNKKAIYILDLSDDSEIEIINKHSPNFKKIFLNDILDSTLDDVKVFFKNNFIDIYVDSGDVMKYNFSGLMNAMEGMARKIEAKIYESDNMLDDTELDEKIENDEFNVINIANKYVKNLSYDADYKEQIINKIKDLYKEALNSK